MKGPGFEPHPGGPHLRITDQSRRYLNVPWGDDSTKYPTMAEVTDKEKFLREASESGGAFDLRSKVGSWWTQALKKDAALKAEYDALGRGYTNQRSFRDNWLKRELEIEVSQRVQKQSYSTNDKVAGTYWPITRIMVEEGCAANYAAAATAAANYAGQCIADHQAGKTHRGKPWVRRNTKTKRYEFLYTSEHVDDTYEERLTAVKKEKPVSRGGDCAQRTDSTAAAATGGLPAGGKGKDKDLTPPAKKAKKDVATAVKKEQQADGPGNSGKKEEQPISIGPNS